MTWALLPPRSRSTLGRDENQSWSASKRSAGVFSKASTSSFESASPRTALVLSVMDWAIGVSMELAMSNVLRRNFPVQQRWLRLPCAKTSSEATAASRDASWPVTDQLDCRSP